MFKNSDWSFWLLAEIWNFKKYGNNKHGRVEMILETTCETWTKKCI